MIIRFVLPVIHIYIMIRVLGNLTGEDFLSESAELMHKVVAWILKTLLACVIGVNVVQGLLAPAIDTLKRSALTRTAEALPWVGNAMGGAAEIFLGDSGPDQERYRDGRGSHCGPHLSRPDRTAGADGIDV